MKTYLRALMITVICAVLGISACTTVDDSVTQKYREEISTSGGLKTFHGSTLDVSGPIPFLVLKGSPYEQGLAYGVLMADELADMMAVHERYQKAEMAKLPFYMRMFAAPYVNGKVKSFLKRTPRRYIDEMQGMADGSGGKLKWIATGACSYYLNAGCTSVLSSPEDGEGVLHGRNHDFSQFTMARFPVLVKYIPANGPIVWTVNTLGSVPFFQGCNEYGISVTINTLDANVTKNEGIPVFWKTREILDSASTVAEADAIIRSTENDSMNFLLTVGSAKEGSGAVYNLVEDLQTAARKTESRPLVVFNRTYEDPAAPADAALRARSDLITVIHENNTNRQKQADAYLARNSIGTREAMWEFLRRHEFTDQDSWGNRGSIANSRNLYSVVFDLAQDSMSFSVAGSWASMREVWNFNLKDSLFTSLLPADPYTRSAAFTANERAFQKVQEETLAGTLDFEDFDYKLGPFTIFRHALYLFNTRKESPEFLSLLENMAEEYPDSEFCLIGLGVYHRRLNPQKAVGYFKRALGFPTLSPLDRLFTTQYLFDAYTFSGDKALAKETAASWVALFDEMKDGYQIPGSLEKTYRTMKKSAR